MVIILTILNVSTMLFKSLFYGIKFVVLGIIEGIASIISLIISLISKVKKGGENDKNKKNK